VKTLFLAWQDPRSRSWYPVGRLTFDGTTYRFVYTQGAEEAHKGSGFQPLSSFEVLDAVYESSELFPLFSNRVPSPSRPDYREFVEWLNIPVGADDPVALLARSGGQRATDSLEVFPCPERTPQGAYYVHFFAHGLRHLPELSLHRAHRLERGERLLLLWDFQNPHDARALMLRTRGEPPNDPCIVGYCPRYLLRDAFELLEKCASSVTVEVERLNLPPAPVANRLLCNLTASWPDGFQPFRGAEYQPIVAGV
jgi:hypothetical protein